jgi:hypothetical protein
MSAVKPILDVPDMQPGRSLAVNAAYTWTMLAIRQAELLLNGASYWEALALLLSLRQLLRAAEMARSSSFRSHRARRILDDAVDQFEADLPDLVNARDIIEHFDEYAVGQGKLQRAEQKADPSLTYADLATRYSASLEGSFDEPVIRVGERSIVVTKVITACLSLFHAMRAASNAEDADVAASGRTTGPTITACEAK